MYNNHVVVTSAENIPIKGTLEGIRHVEKTKNHYVWYFPKKEDADHAVDVLSGTFTEVEMLW